MTNPPPPVTTLGRTDLDTVPQTHGVYAAWIVDPEALDDAAVAGPAPVLAYVGKADRRTLRERIGDHVPSPDHRHRQPFFDLGELLAIQGRVIHGHWHHSADKGPGKYWNTPSALGQLHIDEVLEWQAQHLVWGWRDLPTPEVARHEQALIRDQEPLLNRRGPGLKWNPPQLRRIGPHEDARARWLLLKGWLAVLVGEWERSPWRSTKSFAVTEGGYPRLLDSQRLMEELRVPPFDAGATLNALRDAASDSAIQTALGSGTVRPSELLLWWAHASLTGDPPDYAAVFPADDDSLDLADESATELVLPSPDVQAALIEFIHFGLPGERH